MFRESNAPKSLVLPANRNQFPKEDAFDAPRKKQTDSDKKKAMEDARHVAKTDKRVQKSFDKIREWNLKAAALKAFVKEKRGVLDAAERVMKSKITLYEEQLDVEFKAEYGEMEKAVKQARADYKKAKGRAKQIETGLTKRFMSDA